MADGDVRFLDALGVARGHVEQQVHLAGECAAGLARQGQTKGSAAAGAYGDVADTRARTELQVADQARTASAELRNDVENQRASLVQQLNATADAGAEVHRCTHGLNR